MPAHWKFNTVRPGDRTRESQVEKFFSSQDERATPLIREGIQNSLDADPDDRLIRVRLTLGRLDANRSNELWNRYAHDLIPHLNSMGEKLPERPESGEAMRFLVFEDFETCGLCGDPGQWEFKEGVKNGFFEFFRAEGVSTKEGNSRGRHGVGKFVFMSASRVRTIFGITRRDDGRELLMGTTVLRHHWVDHQHYMPDGWYGGPDHYQDLNVLPLENTADINQFKEDFRLSRSKETGLSIVVPWLAGSVDRDSLIRAAIEGYLFPLMERGLVVEVVDEQGVLERIDHASVRAVVDAQGPDFAKKTTPRLDLAAAAITAPTPIRLLPPDENGSPKWGEPCFPDEAVQAIRHKLAAGELIALHCPTRVTLKNDRQTSPCHFTIFLQRDQNSHDYDVQFLRQGILVSDVKARRIPGIRGLVVIRDGALATFLGDAENPAHTEWQSERVRHYSFNKATIDYVTTAIEEIIRRVQAEDQKPDPLPMKDLFFLPGDEDKSETRQRQKKPSSKPGSESNDVPDLPKPPAQSYTISKVDGGFVVRNVDKTKKRPSSLEVLVAYDTHSGNPFKKYHPADFQLDKGGIPVEYVGVEIKEFDNNRLLADVLADDYEIKVTGFDINRDIIVRTKVRSADSREEDVDAETV